MDEADPERIMKNEEVAQYGFRSADEFRQARHDFIEAHTWAFQSYARAHLLLEGGVDHIHTPPKFLQLVLRCLCTPGGTRNPARTFSFVGHRWCTVEEYTSHPSGARHWAQSAATREAAHQYYIGDPRFVGMLPVFYLVGGIGSMGMNLYPQYRPILASWKGPSEAMFTSLMTDVVALCTSSISLGLALRCADGQESIAALPGRFVRSNKLWVWEPFFSDWERYLAGPRGIPSVDALLDSVHDDLLSVPQLLEVIRMIS